MIHPDAGKTSGQSANASEPPDEPSVLADRPSVWVWPMLVVIVAYTVPLGSYANLRDPNEMSRILCSISMVAYGTLTIDQAMEVYGPPGDDRALYRGRTYSEKAPGTAFFAAPIVALSRVVLPANEHGLPRYWPLRHLLTLLIVGIPGAVLPFLLLRHYPVSNPRRRAALALIFALATPFLTYATHFHGHVLAGVLVGASYCLALRPGKSEKTPTALMAALSGWLAGASVMVEYPTALIGLVIFVALVVNSRCLRTIACFTAGGLLGVLPMLIYHHLAYGAFWETGYSHEAVRQFAEVHEQGLIGVRLPTLDGLWGILFSGRRGMLFYCPLLLTVPVGLVPMARRGLGEVWPLIAVLLLYISFASGFALWTGGSSAAARHLVPVLPLMLFPLYEAALFMSRRTGTWILFVMLTGFSLCGALLSIALTPYFPPRFEFPLVQVTVASLREGAAFPNLVTDVTGLCATWVLAGFALLVTAAVLLALRQLGLDNRKPAPSLFALPLALLAYVGIQMAVAPEPTTLQESNRSVLLQQIGYEEQAQRIRRKLRGMAPR